MLLTMVLGYEKSDCKSIDSVLYFLQLQQKIIPDQDQLMAIALECIYNCERNDQLSLCYDILECLPQRGYG